MTRACAMCHSDTGVHCSVVMWCCCGYWLTHGLDSQEHFSSPEKLVGLTMRAATLLTQRLSFTVVLHKAVPGMRAACIEVHGHTLLTQRLNVWL